jgi:hypothetical protein
MNIVRVVRSFGRCVVLSSDVSSVSSGRPDDTSDMTGPDNMDDKSDGWPDERTTRTRTRRTTHEPSCRRTCRPVRLCRHVLSCRPSMSSGRPNDDVVRGVARDVVCRPVARGVVRSSDAKRPRAAGAKPRTKKHAALATARAGEWGGLCAARGGDGRAGGARGGDGGARRWSSRSSRWSR